MKADIRHPPRLFTVGPRAVEIADCGTIALKPDEQVTFVSQSGAEFDVARKSWGYYATPSLNGRLLGFGLRAVLVRSGTTARYFVLLVESGHEPQFDEYASAEGLAIVAWLDTTEALDRLSQCLSGAS